jgi:hypothetical protein
MVAPCRTLDTQAYLQNSNHDMFRPPLDDDRMIRRGGLLVAAFTSPQRPGVDCSRASAYQVPIFVGVPSFESLCRRADGVLNHANTVSVEDNVRKRSCSHSPANRTVKATTSLHAWCRDNRSERAVA